MPSIEFLKKQKDLASKTPSGNQLATSTLAGQMQLQLPCQPVAQNKPPIEEFTGKNKGLYNYWSSVYPSEVCVNQYPLITWCLKKTDLEEVAQATPDDMKEFLGGGGYELFFDLNFWLKRSEAYHMEQGFPTVYPQQPFDNNLYFDLLKMRFEKKVHSVKDMVFWVWFTCLNLFVEGHNEYDYFVKELFPLEAKGLDKSIIVSTVRLTAGLNADDRSSYLAKLKTAYTAVIKGP